MQLSHQARVCLTESEEVPADWTSLYQTRRNNEDQYNSSYITRCYAVFWNFTVFSLDTNFIPRVLESYQELGVKHEPLKLIPPQFETPLPALQVNQSTALKFESSVSGLLKITGGCVPATISHVESSSFRAVRFGRRIQFREESTGSADQPVQRKWYWILHHRSRAHIKHYSATQVIWWQQ